MSLWWQNGSCSALRLGLELLGSAAIKQKIKQKASLKSIESAHYFLINLGTCHCNRPAWQLLKGPVSRFLAQAREYHQMKRARESSLVQGRREKKSWNINQWITPKAAILPSFCPTLCRSLWKVQIACSSSAYLCEASFGRLAQGLSSLACWIVWEIVWGEVCCICRNWYLSNVHALSSPLRETSFSAYLCVEDLWRHPNSKSLIWSAASIYMCGLNAYLCTQRVLFAAVFIDHRAMLNRLALVRGFVMRIMHLTYDRFSIVNLAALTV